MAAHPGSKPIIAILVVTGLLLGTISTSQSRMSCAAGDETASAGEPIIFCVNAERDRPITDATASAEQATKVVAPLIGWIVAKTGWTVHDAPLIHIIPYAELLKMFNGKQNDLHIEALYADKDHSIYLSDAWRADNVRDRSVLLHELVHHLQYLNHTEAICSSEYEWKAFELQVAWLREQGVEEPFDLLGISALTVYTLLHCPEF